MSELAGSSARLPLKPEDLYRPRLGAQREPISKVAMSELRAWREMSEQAAAAQAVEHAGEPTAGHR